MVEVYKLSLGLYDPGLSNILPNYADHVTEDRVRSGQTKVLNKNRSQLNIRKHYFTIRVVDNGNDLPSNIVNAPSLPSFECRLRQILGKT